MVKKAKRLPSPFCPKVVFLDFVFVANLPKHPFWQKKMGINIILRACWDYHFLAKIMNLTLAIFAISIG